MPRRYPTPLTRSIPARSLVEAEERRQNIVLEVRGALEMREMRAKAELSEFKQAIVAKKLEEDYERLAPYRKRPGLFALPAHTQPRSDS